MSWGAPRATSMASADEPASAVADDQAAAQADGVAAVSLCSACCPRVPHQTRWPIATVKRKGEKEYLTGCCRLGLYWMLGFLDFFRSAGVCSEFAC